MHNQHNIQYKQSRFLERNAQHESKANERRWVFSSNSNTSWVWADSTYKLPHSRGPAAAKARSPLVLSLDVRTSESNSFDDISAPTDVWTWRSSTKYWWARTCNILKTSIKILKSILKRTGSRCWEARTGVMRSRFFCAGQKASSSILHELQMPLRTFVWAHIQRVAIIKLWHDEGMDNSLQVFGWEIGLYSRKEPKLKEGAFEHWANFQI